MCSIASASDATDALAEGEVITFTFSVSNTGNVTLDAVTVDDPLVELSDIDCDGDNVFATLAPGERRSSARPPTR